MHPKISGQERVNHKLSIALKCINNIQALSNGKLSLSSTKRIESNKIRLQKKRKELVFLSTRAKDKVTRFYASNALKEIAQESKKINFNK